MERQSNLLTGKMSFPRPDAGIPSKRDCRIKSGNDKFPEKLQ